LWVRHPVGIAVVNIRFVTVKILLLSRRCSEFVFEPCLTGSGIFWLKCFFLREFSEVFEFLEFLFIEEVRDSSPPLRGRLVLVVLLIRMLKLFIEDHHLAVVPVLFHQGKVHKMEGTCS
jgi:hypothetical protein